MRPGSKVRFWPGAREGVGRIGRTRSEVWDLNGTPVVSIHGYPGGVALTHVELIEEAPSPRAPLQRSAVTNMYRGSSPAPVDSTPVPFIYVDAPVDSGFSGGDCGGGGGE